MEIYQHLITLFAGISIFMFGMNLASDNLQILAADSLRAIMAKLSKHRIFAIIGGVLLTVILQSSGAVTVMLVNLASAGVVNLTQVMGVIVGAAIGTTVTVQLISFDITRFALYILITGYLILFLSNQKKSKSIGTVIFGFGMIFYGLLLMGQAVEIVKEAQTFRVAFQYLSENPLIAFVAATAFTALVSSSAVTIGLAMTLAASHVITLHESLFWVIGANLGTTATALFASTKSKNEGKQVAWAHFFYKAASAILLLIFIQPFEFFIARMTTQATHQVANAHTMYNIFSAVIFYPLIGFAVALIERMLPKPESEKEFGAKYLDPDALKDPPLAFANAVREMLRMAEYTQELVELSIGAFAKDSPDLIGDLHFIDQKIDTLNREIKSYLVRLTYENLSEGQNGRVVGLIALVSDIENIGDVVDKNILLLAQKKSDLKVTFSDQGWKDVTHFHELVVKNFSLAISAFSTGSKELAQKVITNKHDLRILEQKLREAHILRLHLKMQESLNTSNIHMDLLSAFRRVNSYACNLAYPVLFGDLRAFESVAIFPVKPDSSQD